MKRICAWACVLVAALVLLTGRLSDGADGQQAASRSTAVQQMKSGNWKDAVIAFQQLALDPREDPAEVSADLTNGIRCLQQLGRVDEIDAFREQVIAAHAENWRLLSTAAQTYLEVEANGYMIAGKFVRGGHRGGGKYANAVERDRIRALQLLVQAMPLAEDDADHAAVGAFYWRLAKTLLGNRGYTEAWRLQVLSDLATLPDYAEGYTYWRGQNATGAPVRGDGTPVYYAVPENWGKADNDGERWRWAMAQAIAKDAKLAPEIRCTYAGFLNSQFGVETMAAYGWYFRSQDDPQGGNGAAKYALHTLNDEETIARLATGIKRFTLPDEFNPIKVYQQVAEGDGSYANQALQQLGSIFENRRQYDRAADYWQRAGQKDRVAQIVNNWGVFEPVMTQPAGKGARVAFRFRNGKKVSFAAYAIKVDALLNDVKAYIKSNPKQLDWQKVNIGNVGFHFVQDHPSQYLGEKVAAWDQDLTPRAQHFDTRITVNTPLQQAGAYLLVGTMPNGNTSRIILWLADTVIIKKPLEKQVYYYVADAVSGKPLPKATLDFFGYQQNWVRETVGNGGHYDTTTKAFTELTDADGQLILNPGQQPQNNQWLVTATLGAHRAFLGFTNVWYPEQHDEQYEAAKAFFITDRPVYRPAQTMQFKCWVNTAKYDQEGNSAFAGKSFLVRVDNAKGEKVYEKTLTADQYGGFDD
ncbi:MAG TPA: alpha-2-macroglobulin, partial [Armatimonadota bacterium]